MWRETKPSPKTTELWLALARVAVLAVIYNASRATSLDLFRACMLPRPEATTMTTNSTGNSTGRKRVQAATRAYPSEQAE